MPNTSQSVKAVFEQALLAHAAYADLFFVPFNDKALLENKLIAAGMNESAAKYVADKFGVREHGVYASGYSGTLFERRTASMESAEYVFSLRGTDKADPKDFLADAALLFGDGSADDQLNDMRTHFDMLRQIYNFPVNGVDVAGHSLGGHLATVLAGDLNRQDYIRHAFTFNGVGFYPVRALRGEGADHCQH